MFTDEEMDEMGENLDKRRACNHENASEEPGPLQANGTMPLYLVCECGMTRFTGRYDSVL